jgi:protein involved in polysaccharide export with SLBB domain
MSFRFLRAALVGCLLGGFVEPESAAAGTLPPGAAQAAASGAVDLNDPQVRERLRAAGVDPDELQGLMEEKQRAATTAAAPGDATAAPVFPPVTAPPSPPGARDTTAVAADSAAAAQTARYFGYDIFTLKPTTFEPLAFGPVSPDYLIGPGDEIIVSVWGAQELNARAVVNREGFLLLPDVGQVMANGYTLAGFKEHLEKRLARIYSGISRDGRGRTSVEVSLGKLRSMQTFVLGDVVQPGGYTMSATSTAMNALYYAGGPTLKGSLRNIRVLRNNQVIHKVDLYDYVALGNRSQDVKLENGDVLFVPPVAKRVTLEGEVMHPAVFELREGEKLSDLLRLAGGLSTTAYRGRVQIERIIPFEEREPMAQADRKIIDLDLQGGGESMGSSIELRDGDIVRVFRIRDLLKNTVRLVGTAVYKPGTYEHRDGMTVADLVDVAGGLLGDAYLGWAHLVRTRPDRSRELQSFNLGSALQREARSNLVLHQQDEVLVFSVWDIREQEQVSINGLVRKPGKYDLLKGMTITDLIVKAGGLRESAYRVRAEVSRINPEAISEGKTSEMLYVAMSESLRVDSEAAHFVLRKNDIVFIREIPNWSLQENVWVTGEVKFPGMYTLTSKLERLSSVIERAGGLEPTAYLKAATFVRRKDGTGRMAIDFETALEKKRKNKYDLVLAAGDSIHIPREPKTVKVAGEVGFPSSVLWEDGKDMHHYIDQAGGLLETANKDKISVLMANGRVERPSFLRSPHPDAGATIHVPRKPEQKERETLKNFAQIISILSGAATTIYLISRSAN